MTTVRRLIGVLATEALIVAMGGCAAVTSTPWPTSGPGPLSDRMGPGEGRGAGIDGVQPGVPFSWGDLHLYDEAGDPAIIDAVVFDGAPPELRLVAAGALPQMLFGQAMQDFATVPSPLTEAVAARPLIGGEVGPARLGGWTEGALVVFVLQLPRVGHYTIRTFTLQYHVGPDHYTATYRDALDVCVGATVAPGQTCPYASPAPPAGSAPTGAGR